MTIWRISMVAIRIPCFITGVHGQTGMAPNNYYPDTYSGSTFTGTVTAAEGQQIIPTYAKKDKMDTFVGSFETGCEVASTSGRTMMPSNVPTGTVMTAFFNHESKKVNGKNESVNVIIAIAFDTWHGEKVTEDKKRIFWCTKNQHLQFRAWNK